MATVSRERQEHILISRLQSVLPPNMTKPPALPPLVELLKDVRTVDGLMEVMHLSKNNIKSTLLYQVSTEMHFKIGSLSDSLQGIERRHAVISILSTPPAPAEGFVQGIQIEVEDPENLNLEEKIHIFSKYREDVVNVTLYNLGGEIRNAVKGSPIFFEKNGVVILQQGTDEVSGMVAEGALQMASLLVSLAEDAKNSPHFFSTMGAPNSLEGLIDLENPES